MITEEEVKHIAKLARLGLAEEEVGKFQRDLSSILNYFEKLKEVDVSGAEITSHSIKIENVTREDLEVQMDQETPKRLLDLAPKTEKGYLKTKPIF